ncbi:MAG: type II toxin-antitoxin system RelE/ParE family toxin [Oscillospiraceae bacterium]|nr:type II toxin-antitoxin system RelE/ParE family toxin [Oscillospiraceae bacterium]
MNIEYSKQAVKMIARIDTPIKQRIRQAVNNLPEGDTKLLKARSGVWRLRVGNWRILFSYPDKDVILIEKSPHVDKCIRRYKYVYYTANRVYRGTTAGDGTALNPRIG